MPYDRVPGQWQGIVIDSASFDNHFEYVQIRNTTNGIQFKKSDPTIKKATFINSMIHNSTGDGIYAENCWIEGQNSLFTNAQRNVLNLVGGQYDFVHCTIANYFQWRGKGGQYGLVLANQTSDEDGEILERPLLKANFINCVIAGTSRKSISLNQNVNIPSFEHLFTNCVIHLRAIEANNFINTIWEDPKLKKTSTLKEGSTDQWDYLFNFELDSISPAIDKADMVIASSLPLDIRGISRLSDGKADIGCYEWIATETKSNRLFIKK